MTNDKHKQPATAPLPATVGGERWEPYTPEAVSRPVHRVAAKSVPRSLDAVVKLPDQGDGGEEAAAIVAEELSESYAALERANNKSPFIKSAIGGVSGLAITGVSAATTGVVTGNPWAALASGAAAKLAESVAVYAKALKARAKARAVLDAL